MTSEPIEPGPVIDRDKLINRASRNAARYNRWYTVNGGLFFIVEVSLLLTTALTAAFATTGSTFADTVPAIATIAFALTGLRQIFRPQERWLSYSVARRDLYRELDRYQLLAHPTPRDDRKLLTALEAAEEGEYSRFLTIRKVASEEDKDKPGGEAKPYTGAPAPAPAPAPR